MGAMSYPLINGMRASWAEISFKIKGAKAIGVKEISYRPSLEGSDVYGTGVMPIGRTRGQAKFEASVTLNKEEFDALIKDLGDGYGEKPFDIVVQYRLEGVALVNSDRIVACRIKSPDQSHAQGADALTVKVDLHPADIILNGLSITTKKSY